MRCLAALLFASAIALSRAQSPAPSSTIPQPPGPDTPALAVPLVPLSVPISGTYVATKGKGVSLSLVFLDDHRVRLTVSGGGPTDSSEGIYAANGDKVTVTVQGETTDLTRKDDTLKGKLHGEPVKFVRT